MSRLECVRTAKTLSISNPSLIERVRAAYSKASEIDLQFVGPVDAIWGFTNKGLNLEQILSM